MHLSKLRLGVVGVACAMVVGMGASPAWAQCVPAPSGLVSWWPGDGDANDIIGSNPATTIGGVSFLSAKVDQGFDLDGTVRLEAPDSASLDISGADVVQFLVDLKAQGIITGRELGAILRGANSP